MQRAILKSAVFFLGLTLAQPVALAQDPAAERARLANQRIQAEAERRAEEQRAREADLQSIAAETPIAQTPAPSTSETPAAARPETRSATQTAAPADERVMTIPGKAGSADLSLALEQLKTLGELKDAGHVTEEEFERIKRRILDSNF